MNGRVAKRMRRAAERLTIGKPEVDYDLNKRRTAIVIPPQNSTRGAYRHIKKTVKKEARHG